MPTSTNIIYYPSTATIWAGPAVWYICAAIVVILMAVIFIAAREAAASTKAFACIALAICVSSVGALLKTHPPESWNTPVFAPKTTLQTLWENYTTQFIEASSGRTIDDAQTGETTSEAEGYTMLRAVWMDDEPTFDASWKWTQTNLQHKDGLFSWLYGKEPNGTYGILTAQNGENSASDADTDIALALVFAYSRWQNPQYLQAAIPIIHDIWQNDVFTVNGTPYLGPDDLAASSNAQEQLIDPSYFSPYAYRIFTYLDPHDNWQGLIDSSYQILDKGIQAPIDVSTSAGLPPDWMEMNVTTGALSAPPTTGSGANVNSTSETTDFGYDALRVPFRIALDWEWYGDPQASATLGMMAFLGQQWKQYGFLDAVYSHNGDPAAYYQTPAMYGGAMGYFIVADPSDAEAVYEDKLASLYDPDTETWKQPLDYYDANIAWFGMALYDGDLPNLFALNLPTSTTSTSTP